LSAAMLSGAPVDKQKQEALTWVQVNNLVGLTAFNFIYKLHIMHTRFYLKV